MYNLISHLFILKSHAIHSRMKVKGVHIRQELLFLFIFVLLNDIVTALDFPCLLGLETCNPSLLKKFCLLVKMCAHVPVSLSRETVFSFSQSSTVPLEKLSPTAYQHHQMPSDPCSSYFGLVPSNIHRYVTAIHTCC